jgi:hypothetical protein
MVPSLSISRNSTGILPSLNDRIKLGFVPSLPEIAVHGMPIAFGMNPFHIGAQLASRFATYKAVGVRRNEQARG